MRVIIKDTKQEASVWAAAHIAAAIKAKAQKTDAPFVLGLPTGSTPLDTYACSKLINHSPLLFIVQYLRLLHP